MKKTILLFFVLLLLCSFAYAAPPFQDFSGSVKGLEIRIPQAQYISFNQSGVKSHIHVFNTSDGVVMTNVTTSCYLHLYNSLGSHYLEEEYGFDSNGLDFDLDIAAGNFTMNGLMSYIIWCNTSNYGGFVAGGFQVTPDGLSADRTDTTAGIAIVMFLLFIVLFLLFVGFKVDATNNFYVNLIIKRSAFVLAIFLMVLNSTMLATIAGSANLNLTKELFTYMTIFGYAGYLAMVVLVFKTLLDYLEQWKTDKNERRMGKDD